ncbi:hypothetical protein GCM10022267_70910 [Lentzea roselyniae]|uniref:Integrase core domain-containing protein n=1 Tax=Lentzea roselyniae TaxID=531940 RepID=A0ABP7C0P5_9PSEU
MDLEDTRRHARFLIRDRGGTCPALFDAVLANVGIRVVLSSVRIPRMNAIMERWIRTCRHELLDRTLRWNQRHLLHALREYEKFHNTHRPIKASPTLDRYSHCNHGSSSGHQLNSRRRQRLGPILNEYHHAA